MKLLTYHGTIVRRPVGGSGLVHVPLRVSPQVSPPGVTPGVTLGVTPGALHGSMPGAGAAYVDAELGEDEIAAAVSALDLGAGPLAVEPGPAPGTVRLRSGGHYVCAEPGAPELAADRAEASIWETFLLLSEGEAALLRWMIGQEWAAAGGEPGGRAALVPAFGLRIGGEMIDLLRERPRVDRVSFAPADDAEAVRGFDWREAVPKDDELPLRPADEARRRLPVVDREAFLRHGERALAVVAAPDVFELPIVAGPGDAAFIQDRFWNGQRPALGTQQARCEIRRSGPKYVLLQRYCEGILFDEHGTYSEAGYFHTLQTCPPGLRRDGDVIKLDRALMADAPRLPGPFAVVFNPHLSNYYHWLVEGMLALDVMREHLPGGTRILLPGTLAEFRATGRSGFDHRRLMDLLGFGHLPFVEVAAPVCQVEEAVWLEKYSIDQIPGQALVAFRDRIERRIGTGRPRRRRIYIQRQGLRRIANAEAVEAFCAAHGFSFYRLEDTPDDEQIRIFQEAEFVLAPHGAGLSNLLFCQPGTKVIELSPDVEFRPFFWQIGQRLGLRYGVMPCPTSDGTFHGNMTVDIERLRTLYGLVENAPVPQLLAV